MFGIGAIIKTVDVITDIAEIPTNILAVYSSDVAEIPTNIQAYLLGDFNYDLNFDL